jgi:hypothetical protein
MRQIETLSRYPGKINTKSTPRLRDIGVITMFGRLVVSLSVGAVAASMTWFVLTYIGADLSNPLFTLVVVGIALAWTLVAFARS